MACIIFFTFSIGATTEIWIYVMSFLLYTKHYTRIYNIIPVFAFFFILFISLWLFPFSQLVLSLAGWFHGPE